MYPQCRIEMFGGLRIRRRSQLITRFPTYKTGALLAYLAYYKHHSHPREVLIEMFWPDTFPEAGRQSLSRALSSLRHQLEPPGMPAGSVLLADRTTLQVSPDAISTDVAEFDAALKAAQLPSAAPGSLEEAARRYTGVLLPGCYEEWVLRERERLNESYLGLVGRLIVQSEQGGDLARAREYARQAVYVDPLREESQVTLIHLSLALGEPSVALRHYRRFEQLLEQELGMAPDAGTQALVQDLLLRAPRARSVRPRSARSAAASKRVEGAVPVLPGEEAARFRATSEGKTEASEAGNLLVPLTRFFGRTWEIGQVRRMLGGCRLVTLTGPGGIGKTRLAVEATRQGRAPLGGTVWFVPLADVADPRLIPEAIATALDLPPAPSGSRLAQVIAALARQPALLILDNFEQFLTTNRRPEPLAESVEIVQTLLEKAPELVCLVTSRQVLGLAGEREFIVPPLPTPDGSRADTPEQIASLESVALFVDRAQAVRPDFQITRRNAAAVAVLCERLEGIPLAIELAAARSQVLTPAQMLSQIGRRFDFLVSRKRDLAYRHRTLWASIDWSYQLLSPELQRFFRHLSVFRGGWSVEAAEAISSILPPSSLTLDALEQLRECSLVLTEEADGEMRYRMLETLRAYAESRMPPEEQADLARRHARWLLAFSRQAWEQIQQGHEETARRWTAWQEREADNYRIAMDWCLENGEMDMAVDLIHLYVQWRRCVYFPEAPRWLETAIRIGQNAPDYQRAVVFNVAGQEAQTRGDQAAARAHFEHSLALFRALDAKEDMAGSLRSLGDLASDPRESLACYEQSAALFLEAGREDAAAWAMVCQAIKHSRLKELDAAGSLFGRSLALARLPGKNEFLDWILLHYALFLAGTGEIETAQAALEESLALFRARGAPTGIARVQCVQGRWALRRGDHPAASAHFAACLRTFRQRNNRSGVAETLYYQAEVARAGGDLREAAALCAESLQTYHALQDIDWTLLVLEQMASLTAQSGAHERAARLLGAASALRRSLPYPHGMATATEDALARTQTALKGPAFQTAWTSGSAMTPDQAVAFALETV
jgi:predicted ATPase/DNA-binding SARP family transcriptional activator